MKGSELVKLLRKDGWYIFRQSATSHVVFKHPTKEGQLIVPIHGSKEVRTGTLIKILKQADIQNKQTMNKPKIKLQIIKEEVGYGASGNWKDRHLFTCADNWKDLQVEILEMVNLAFEDLGFSYSMEEIHFEFDLKSFFDFYKVINVKALSERIGMNQSLLAQYISGIKKPSKVQTKRILDGVHQIGKELIESRLIMI